jgi:hypothetical protein
MQNAVETRPISLGDWLITLIVVSLPIIGLIMLLVWAFSAGTHPSKKTFCQAALILMVIAIVLVFALGGMAFLTTMGSMGTSGM